MSRFLMPMWEGGGTIPPMLGVARRLIARGHTVHVLGDPTIAEEAAAAGCAFTPWKEAPHRTSLDPAEDLIKDWEAKNPLALLRKVRDTFLLAPAAGYAADTRRAIEDERPDALIPDAMLLGTLLAAEAAGIPTAPLLPNVWMFPTAGLPPVGPGFALATGPLGRMRDRVMLAVATRVFDGAVPRFNVLRAAYGLGPLPHLFDQVLRSDRLLVLTSPTFDYAAAFAPPNVRYVGPVLDDPDWAEPWTSPWPADDPRPLVLVGFSSTFQDQGVVLRRVVEALSSLEVRALVTLGEMLEPSEVPGTENVHVVRSAPHAQVLRDAAAVVTHCGHGTTLKTLAAGVPMVCMPMGRDQNDTAARVVHHGAGVRLGPGASAAKIRAALTTALEDPTYRTGAGRLAATLAEESRRLDPVAELEALLARAATESAPASP